MSAIFLGLLAVLLIGWSSALPLTRDEHDDTDNIIEEDEDSQTRLYFQEVAKVMEKARGQPSNETGARVAEYNPDTDTRNPEELGSYYEGDILYPDSARNGLIATSAKWPGGIIPVRIDVGFNILTIGKILHAMAQYFLNVPCLKIVPWTFQKDYVHITSQETGCWSFVGRVGGAQKLNLQSPGCVTTVGTVLHELMHAAGFLHEQSREDRDNHVIIITENIDPTKLSNFNKASAGSTTFYAVPYNYQSVMHYSNKAFSKNGLATIVGKPDASVAMGQRAGFSPGDIKKLRAMYGCPA